MALNRNEHELCSHRGSRLQALLPPSTGGGLLCLACLQCLFTANNFAMLLCCEVILPYSEGESLPKIQTELALPWLGGSQLCPVCITALAQVVWTFGPVWWITALPCLALPCLALPWGSMLTLFAWHKVCLVVVVGHNFALMLCCDPGTNCLDICPVLVDHSFALPCLVTALLIVLFWDQC